MTTKSERDNALRRLKKILALTSSSNPGEAAAALQQARTIMDKFGLDAVDAEAASITEERCKMGSADVNGWRNTLIAVVKNSLGVEVLISKPQQVKGKRRSPATVIFIGEGHKPKIAAYALSVLQRSITAGFKKATEDMIREMASLGEVKVIKKQFIKQKHRDSYALTWCHAVRSKVESLTSEPSTAMKRYMQKYDVVQPAAESLPTSPSRRKKPDPLSAYLLLQGLKDGRNVNLNKAVDTGPQQARLL